MITDPILRCQGLHKIYKDAEKIIPVLSGIDFQVAPNEKIAIVGKSGSGKTTLIHLLGGLDRPSEGKIFFENTNIHHLSDRKLGFLRNHLFGYIFQFHHLLPEFTALENVAMPLLIRGIPIAQARERSDKALMQVGLDDRKTHKPNKLSGGERQRVAIARALVTKPKCIFADEPTGNLDQATATKIYDLMIQLAEEVGTSFVVVTHDDDLASRMDRVVRLEQGQLQQL
ncbi:MAG TPA: lipoprotein-releasing ABC transporter ATP-binding protein LolD [Gammaproteobacteria bacterium]|nr:lipoprotein-releasing ABC transporter ATP-binding protein LolD [Gammaproteobacteria bacterium]